MTNSNQRNTTVGYGYFAEYPYPELLDKFRSLHDHGIKLELIWSFGDDREMIYALFRFPRRNTFLRNEPNVIYSRRRGK